eukprot:CAMPEP_0114430666 /NCGR_PEP_ID=MMETSP0103-20121206/10166_1 /TAXON_ID=37642 ORGANISM="Paraphysomonas imperforata, Strain PA2" /NCGR_SAMPLE_ID=MMETSP0103 /ASSEMBLY_ACC=CAM_ASM_000201 /LENGTH=1113 /DNA_ID=CAMNT_0001600135 /DNA_START=58 /DNA_END=3399 /DNA_ORIENTATION=+
MHRVSTEYTKVENHLSTSNVKVYVRARPPDTTDEITFMDPTSEQKNRILIKDPNESSTKKYSEVAFHFDRVFWIDTQQQEIFDTVCRPQVDHVLKGYNACCFAYGQTGSGKTYSMFGEDGDYRGIIPRAVEHVFNSLGNLDDDPEDVSISCTFLEIYNDSVRDLGKAYFTQKEANGKEEFINEKTSDLFNNINRNRSNPYFAPAFAKKNSAGEDDFMKRPGLKQVMGEYQSMNLQIHEDSQGNVFVKDLTSIPLTYMEEALEVVTMGIKVRATHETKMNNVSSRSHTVFNLTVTHRDKATGDLVVGMLNLVDLAGSERIKKSESQGPRLKEALHINSSLSALGKVVIALEQGAHVPYRDSKLTRLLQNSLGGNSYTSLLTAIHPCPNYYDECLSTLQFANRCLNVQNNPRVNYVGDEGVEDKDRKIRRLMEEINQMRVKLAQFERGGGGGMMTGIALAEKMVAVLHKMGISASIGADGALRTADGKAVSLNELNDLAAVAPDADETMKQREIAASSFERTPAQMKVHIEDLEKENDALRQKSKFSKAKVETLSKQLQETSDEFDRKKQQWQHREFLLKRATSEAEVQAQGIQDKMSQKHAQVYKDLIDANKEIVATNLDAMNKIPGSLKEIQLDAQKKKHLNTDAYILPLKEGYEKTLANYKESKTVELQNQKQQYEYWLLEKDQALAKMLSGFNKYREKKSAQMRKCEQEIVSLYTYAEKLEVVVKMAEEGKFYTQQSQQQDTFESTAMGRGATMIIPNTLKPTRPGSEKTKSSQLALSQRIVKKNKEHIAHNEQIKNDAIEAMLLKHGGNNSMGTNKNEDFMESPAMTNQIRALISSPSVGRDLVGTASTPPDSSRQKPDKREQLFSRETPSGKATSELPFGNETPFNRRHTIGAHQSPPRSTDITTRAHHDTVGGPGHRGAKSIRKTVSIDEENKKSSDNQFAEFDTSSLFRNPENIKYVFNDNEADLSSTVILPKSNFDTMIMAPESSPTDSNPVKSFQEMERLRLENKQYDQDIARLEAEVIDLREQLEANEQSDINLILESVEGNETLEYIRQLESEQVALRGSVKEVSNQLQNSKVANAALSRQFEAYKSQMKKRPASGRVITMKS